MNFEPSPIQVTDNDDINYHIKTTSSIDYNQNSLSRNNNNNNNNNININENSNFDSEKETLLSALRKEMIINEEQRNYIEILKEALASNLFKTGFVGLILESEEYKNYLKNKNNNNPNDKKNIVDFFIDFNRFKTESEKYKKDYKNLLNKNNEYKNILNSYEKKFPI